MNFAVLSAELTGDPLGRGYSGMTNKECVVSLNTADRSKIQPFSMAGLRERAAEEARGFKVLQGISNDGLPDQVRNLCYLADKLIGTDDGALDPGNPIHVGLVNGLVAGGIITSDDKDALVTKATVSISRAEELGLTRVKEGHVQEARK